MTVERTFDDNEPYSTVRHINNCAFNAWYPKYRSLVPKCKVLEVPVTFVEYLNEDGIRVPDDGYKYTNTNEDSGSEDIDEDAGDDKQTSDPAAKFQEFHESVKEAIKALGGTVTPKLNWSSPKDATWISTTGDLKCVTPSDIYLLLKASSYITHDLCEAYSECTDYERSAPEKIFLILRQWFEVVPALEFRCFVKNNELVAICQRDMNYYSFLEPMEADIKRRISGFFVRNLQNQFPDSQFVFDVYLARQSDRVWLIDINPFARKTDTFLYSWPELLQKSAADSTNDIELRLVEKLDSSRGFSAREHTENHVPADFVNMASKEELLKTIKEMEAMRMSQEKEQPSDEQD